MKIPELANLDLSYETGVHVGDGTMIKNDHDSFVAYYGNFKTEKDYFKLVLLPLLLTLYKKQPRLEHFENSLFLRISSKELVDFKSKTLKLPIGNKSKLNALPQFIINNGRQHIFHFIAGIFDTDGTVKLIKRPNGLYPRLRITLKNKEIIFQIKDILAAESITATIYHDRRYDKRIKKRKSTWDLDINGFDNLTKFTQIIPLRNPNHLNRIELLIKQ
jgi:hypothetical protein